MAGFYPPAHTTNIHAAVSGGQVVNVRVMPPQVALEIAANIRAAAKALKDRQQSLWSQAADGYREYAQRMLERAQKAAMPKERMTYLLRWPGGSS